VTSTAAPADVSAKVRTRGRRVKPKRRPPFLRDAGGALLVLVVVAVAGLLWLVTGLGGPRR